MGRLLQNSSSNSRKNHHLEQASSSSPHRRLVLFPVLLLALSGAIFNIFYGGLSGSTIWLEESSADVHTNDERDSPSRNELPSIGNYNDLEAAPPTITSRDLQTANDKFPYKLKNKNNPESEPVGTFNGYDLYFIKESPRTKVHCVGDTYQEETSWMYRSCEYERLCFDLEKLDFVIYQHENIRRTSPPSLPNGWYSSTLRGDETNPVMGMTVNAKARNTVMHAPADPSSEKTPHGFFHPRVVKDVESLAPSSYYLLNVTLIPFFRYYIGYRNPGHHLWQDLVSLYTLIEMFDKENSDILLVPLKQKIPKGYFREGKADLMNKWGSKLMGMPNFEQYNPFWEDGEFDIRIGGEKVSTQSLRPSSSSSSSSPLVVCAQSGLMGLAQFSQHETHHHNGTHFRAKRRRIDREIIPFWSGRGGFFRRFRHFMMRKLGVVEAQNERQERIMSSTRSHFTILFSQHSSGRGSRANTNFEMQMSYLESELSLPKSTTTVRIENATLAKMTIEEQVQKMLHTDVFFSATGGGTASAIFLPKGAHLILFYEDWFLDWDYWENISDIHVHWIPIEHLDDPKYLPSLKFLIEQALLGLY